jgi:hypothetical protein
LDPGYSECLKNSEDNRAIKHRPDPPHHRDSWFPISLLMRNPRVPIPSERAKG